MSGQEDLAEFAISMARMARDLAVQATVQDTLDHIVTHAVSLVDGCDHAGILLLHGGQRVETAAATGDLVHDFNHAQAELGEGPCFDAAKYKEPVYRIADMQTTVQRWPRYAPRARELGVGSVLGFLLFTEENDLGALDLYSHTPSMFTEHSELVGWVLASHAAVAFSASRTSAQLRAAIATRQEIGEALGIIMERHKVTEDDAFQWLKKISQDRNVKLRDLACDITTTGELPTAK